jgi:Tol biopolymer transport system component
LTGVAVVAGCSGDDNDAGPQTTSDAVSTRIAFVSLRDDDASDDDLLNTEIYVMNAGGGGEMRLTESGTSDVSPSWSPDGSRIAFISDRSGSVQVYVMNADGSAETRLSESWTTQVSRTSRPAWSPDSSKVAVSDYRNGKWEIYAMNADGSEETRLTQTGSNIESPADYAPPSWSPDGSKIAFTAAPDRHLTGNLEYSEAGWLVTEIAVMNADGTGKERLTTNRTPDFSPAWSPEGSKIAFVSEHGGGIGTYVINPDGTGEARLANDWDIDGPIWSPDGSKLAYIGGPNGGTEIFVMNADGTGEIRVAQRSDRIDGPLSWSPDGSKIAFSGWIGGDQSWIFVANADGSGVGRLSQMKAVDTAPTTWSPG